MLGRGATESLDRARPPVASRGMADLTAHEERIAHLIRQVEDLSDVVAGQERRIATLERRLALLMEREARREDGQPTLFFGDLLNGPRRRAGAV